MDTKQGTREQISALADGELQDDQLVLMLAALRNSEERDAWELYHRMGDALRSNDVSDIEFSAGFASRLSARLDAEPTVLGPALAPQQGVSSEKRRRWALPGFAAAAAMAGIAFVGTPQLMVAFNGESSPGVAPAPLAGVQAELPSTIVPVTATTATASVHPVEAESGAVVLRDPHIDDYLIAHQRFSPSVYSSAQYARSAALPAQPEK